MDNLRLTLFWAERIVLSLMVVGMLAGGVVARGGESWPVALVPQPVRTECKAGTFELKPDTAILVEKESAAALGVGRLLSERIKRSVGLELRVSSVEGTAPVHNAILLRTKRAGNAVGAEGYTLEATEDGVVIAAGDGAGLFYGSQTLLQLLPPQVFSPTNVLEQVKWVMPAMHIEDQPRFPWRGLLLDVARHFFNQAEVKSFIDLMAQHKLNTLQLHLTDGQAWRIAIKNYPKLTQIGAWRKDSSCGGQAFDPKASTAYGPDGRYGGYYTADDIRELVAYAKARYVTVVPEIEMPGHAAAAITAYPEYSCAGGPNRLDETGEVVVQEFCAGNDATFEFLEGVLTEVMDLFPSKRIHIGGDEASKAHWRQCQKCQARIKQEGLKNEEELQSYFVRRIGKFLQAHDRRLAGWGDILQGGLPPNAVVMSYNANGYLGVEAGIPAANAGHDVVMTSFSHCYFDYYQAKTGEPPARGQSLIVDGILPLKTVYSFEPVPAAIPADKGKHILGAAGLLWSECAPNYAQVEYMVYPRACAMAEVTWTDPRSRKWDDFRRRLDRHLLRLKAQGVHYRAPKSGDPGYESASPPAVIHEIDFSQATPKPDPWLKLGGKSPGGTVLGVNHQYWTRNGQPWLPVMGEFHYVRYPAQEWERQLIAMKSGGLSIVATYVLWVNHENPKGTWKWDGDEDLRRFVQLCQKHGLYVWLRAGPYCNAESRNGGYPDFIAQIPNKRSNDPAYLAEVERFYARVGEQVRGLMFKDGGPIIGFQLENEFAEGKPEHIDTLQQMAIRHGIIAPYYSVTANTRFSWREGTAFPLQGAYPYRGWGPLGFPTQDFMYRSEAWGAMFNEYGIYYDLTRFPLGFCEMGAGCWYNYNDRFIVPARDAEAMVQDTLGRGSCLIGYYMFQGGTQRAGAEMAGHPLSYDFQAPLGEFGFAREAYHRLKLLHYFVNDYGPTLAPMTVVYPATHPTGPRDTNTFRYVGRHLNGRGFLFMNDTQAWVEMQDQKDIQMRLKLPDGRTLTFPEKPFTLQRGTYAIFPCHLDVNGAALVYATAQPLARFEVDGTLYCFFFAVTGIEPEFAFDPGSLKALAAATTLASGGWTLTKPKPGLDSAFSVTANDGRKTVFVTLSREQAERSWRARYRAKERLFISDANLAFAGDMLMLHSAGNPRMTLHAFPAIGGEAASSTLFGTQEFSAKPVDFRPNLKRISANEWQFTVDRLAVGLRDVQVAIHFIASTGELWVDGKKYTDLRYNGTPWMIGLNRFFRPQVGAHTFTVKVSAWDSAVKGIAREAQPKTDEERKGVIKSIDFIPDYQVMVRP